jgi:predicted CxxxxCH...CXXCH cytochrome family protein
MNRPNLLALAALLAVPLAACDVARPVAGEEAVSSAACIGCHGGEGSAAPPHSTKGATSTADVGVGAHAAHLKDGPFSRAIACGECHVVPRSVADAGHMDGKADVTFGPVGSIGEQARWDRATATCAVYCHGSMLPGGSVKAPVWTKVDGTQAACGACHGAPPPAPHPQIANCSGCHPATVRSDGSIDVAGGAHINGKLDLNEGTAACGSCHGIPPPAPHAQSTSCGSCHPGYSATSVNAATHQNGKVDVNAQACGSCHAIPPSTGQHGRHVSRGYSCGTCHAGFTKTTAGASHLNGKVDVTAPGWNGTSCANSCHGTERW